MSSTCFKGVLCWRFHYHAGADSVQQTRLNGDTRNTLEEIDEITATMSESPICSPICCHLNKPTIHIHPERPNKPSTAIIPFRRLNTISHVRRKCARVAKHSTPILSLSAFSVNFLPKCFKFRFNLSAHAQPSVGGSLKMHSEWAEIVQTYRIVFQVGLKIAKLLNVKAWIVELFIKLCTKLFHLI